MQVAAPEQLQVAAGLLPLPQLLNVDTYNPNTLLDSYRPRIHLEQSGKPPNPALENWLQIFRDSVDSFRRTAEADPSRPEEERRRGADQFASTYLAALADVERQAQQACGDSHGSGVGCLELCRQREQALQAAGFTDIFLPIKRRENDAALALLPDVCAEVDQHTDKRQRWEAVLRGVFAGNIFDLGCKATTEAYHEGGIGFHATRDKLVPRPWVVDHLDPLIDRLCSHSYKRAVLFVDNSGADIMLGMLPFARELLRQGSSVIIAANSLPSINDITAAELEALLPRICAADPVLCKGVSTRRLQVVASGSGLPVIDLRKVSAELAEAAAEADLVVLEGMGRSIETNLRARFSCDSLNLGMIKHPEVAQALGGRLYDCVCQFRRAGSA